MESFWVRTTVNSIQKLILIQGKFSLLDLPIALEFKKFWKSFLIPQDFDQSVWTRLVLIALQMKHYLFIQHCQILFQDVLSGIRSSCCAIHKKLLGTRIKHLIFLFEMKFEILSGLGENIWTLFRHRFSRSTRVGIHLLINMWTYGENISENGLIELRWVLYGNIDCWVIWMLKSFIGKAIFRVFRWFCQSATFIAVCFLYRNWNQPVSFFFIYSV